MNQERPNEKCARIWVEAVTGIPLEHADKTGGVDYISRDGSTALEVTRVTDERRRRANAARRNSQRPVTSAELRSCWLIVVPDRQPRMKGLAQRTIPSLVQLEAAGQTSFSKQDAKAQVRCDGPMAAVYEELLRAGIERASARGDAVPSGSAHIHRILLSPGSGGGQREPGETLEWLERELNSRQDNFRKLAESGARQCHLFVWLDDDSPYAFAWAVLRASSSGASESLPSRQPRLDRVITHLWVVHDKSEAGWLWDGAKWHVIRKSVG